MTSQPQPLHLLVRHLHPGLVLAGQQDGPDPQARCRCRILEVTQQDEPRTQWLAGPVDTDEAEQTVLDRVPLRSATGIMTYRDLQPQAIRQLLLQLLLPQPRPTAITTSRIGQDQEFGSLGN